ncbi:MAG TPA: hypothetical protein DDW76_37705 [Cyanobacteria bacterium UBA11369]|nr:hypothetical protein [Cyanobacteria bacterium UBA11371]HBE36434.1 hypothetical protein [Cyanobacteria bacterium UBA11368]HBE54334.1 hypothetical protein [Cyanobacteria bacterium UBA11369]
MAKFKLCFLNIFLVFCILLAGCVDNNQRAFYKQVYSEMAATSTAKQELAKAVLLEAEIGNKYDLYLGNSIDMAVAPETEKKAKFVAWMQALLVREAGWKYVEGKYIDQLEANFSETELKELLNLAKQPLMKKLRQAEIQAYINTTGERRELLFKVWDGFNSGVFNPPPDVQR